MDCRTVSREMNALGRAPEGEVPLDVRAHLAECGSCARAWAAARMSRGLLEALEDPVEPPPGFATRVLAALPRRSSEEAEAWRSAWGLLPAFAAAAVALVLAYGEILEGVPVGLLPVHELTAGEALVFQEQLTNPDLVLSAILEGGR